MSHIMTGGCQCGRIRYRAVLEDYKASLCHCRMCQRATGGIAAFLSSLPRTNLVWDTEPEWYASSPFARRPFCSACGSPLGFEYLDSANINLTVGSFDDPSSFMPEYQFATESRLDPWRDFHGLPATRSDEYQPLVDRWEKARST